MTHIPAKILHIDRGTLSVGAVADLTLIDPERVATVDSAQFQSKSRNTPFKRLGVDGLARNDAPQRCPK